MPEKKHNDNQALLIKIRQKSLQLGFQQLGVADCQLDDAEQHLNRWLEKGYHGEMDYMARHGNKRSRPAELEPGTLRIISVRMDYLPPDGVIAGKLLQQPDSGYISRYALGRDYHKVVRKRLQQLADYIQQQVGAFGYRAFVDSAPVLEKALAEKAGLGWIGKHSNLINRQAGSWFFLGELYTDLPLPIDIESRAENHCGRCTACIDLCPTQAIVAPYQVDGRRCISYLTIELHGVIPIEFRKAIGNRIYGCDDCQLACPWNRFARYSREQDFLPRHGLAEPELIELFLWSEATFLDNMAGSPIRRIGHTRWIRNIAVALGNAPSSEQIISALLERADDKSELIREHVAWALAQHQNTP
ncbi:MAG: tRNA epoxyqueuosine(34) reductase QueG [Gammaproteobacteria bacterium]|nr:tRNA epoxyqueuosine(34) reductase QueG [Gammaproteobacteria bacterium]MCF6230317.1 tRNA epoxyqueuosine(34) reductase QueG [Gammaproteobacteria bacterium]